MDIDKLRGKVIGVRKGEEWRGVLGSGRFGALVEFTEFCILRHFLSLL